MKTRAKASEIRLLHWVAFRFWEIFVIYARPRDVNILSYATQFVIEQAWLRQNCDFAAAIWVGLDLAEATDYQASERDPDMLCEDCTEPLHAILKGACQGIWCKPYWWKSFKVLSQVCESRNVISEQNWPYFTGQKDSFPQMFGFCSSLGLAEIGIESKPELYGPESLWVELHHLRNRVNRIYSDLGPTKTKNL